jgi:drug/metabolite transporter (DMT)-like permease
MLGETMNVAGVIGMAISICGILWFTRATQQTTDESVDRKRISSGILFAIIGAVTQGLGLVCSKKGLNIIHSNGPDLNPVHATWIRIGIAMLAAYSLAIFKRNVLSEIKVMSTTARITRPLLLGTLFGPVLGVSLSLLAATQLKVGIAQTIFSLQPLTVMFAATVSGKEKLNASSVIAAMVSMFGVFVLVWRD